MSRIPFSVSGGDAAAAAGCGSGSVSLILPDGTRAFNFKTEEKMTDENLHRVLSALARK